MNNSLEMFDFYTSKAQYHHARMENFQKKENLLSFLRLVSFLGLLVLIILCFNFSVLAGTLSIFPAIAIFGFVLNQHLRTTQQKLKNQFLKEINQAEADCLQGNFSGFKDGHEFDEKDHPYTYDLDIFGKHSLYQYINRTSTQPGAALLAQWLKEPATAIEITQRQEAIRELKEKYEWRQDNRAIYYLNPASIDSPQPLLEWCNEPGEFHKKYLNHTLRFLALTNITLITLSFWGLPEIWIYLSLSISFFINSTYFNKVNKIQIKLSKSFSLLTSYFNIIQNIENEKFKSNKLVKLQNFLTEKNPASRTINKLAKISKKLDYRLNPLVGIPLNFLFFWDIQQCIKLEKWKKSNNNNIYTWFSVMAEFDALSSLSNLHFNQPQWVFPEINNFTFKLDIANAGHPLIIQQNRVVNNFNIDHNNKIAIITGSNMSGKSTFLRTLGVNMVLAFTGAPVCATKFNTSLVKIYTSMRISDSLEDNTSSFYAELKKLAGIINVVEKKEKVFLLLDEILRGTNSNDRHTGSVALIKQLVKNNAPAILATHDLSLSHLTDELPENIDLYNFDVKINGEELFFDYKLNTGICKSLNASILMKKMGIEI